MSRKALADSKKNGASNGASNGVPEEIVPIKLNSTDSLYRGVIVACLRSKQLIKGATPRTSAEFSHKRKSTIIAMEEVKQGLVFFEEIPEEE